MAPLACAARTTAGRLEPRRCSGGTNLRETRGEPTAVNLGADRGIALTAELVQVEPTLYVANLIGQHGLKRAGGLPPVRYEAIRSGLALVRSHARRLGASVHLPRIGCGLAGGRREQIEPLVDEELGHHGVAVTVYDLA